MIKAEQQHDAHFFKAIAQQVQDNQITGVSYDLKADNAVVSSLQHLLPQATRLYAWNTDFSFTDPATMEKAAKLEHLTRLLISFPSPYTDIGLTCGKKWRGAEASLPER